MLKDGGRVILGDYYYPDSVSDEEVAAYMAYQQATINHADPREKFVKPELIAQKAQEHGFSIELSDEMQAVKEIDRKYSIFVLKKEPKS